MSSAYARYYAKKRDELTAKMREKYDPEKKKAYYNEHAEHIKADMAERYKRQKEERNSKILHEILAKSPPDHIKEKVNQLLNSDIGAVHLKTLTFLQKQIA